MDNMRSLNLPSFRIAGLSRVCSRRSHSRFPATPQLIEIQSGAMLPHLNAGLQPHISTVTIGGLVLCSHRLAVGLGLWLRAFVQVMCHENAPATSLQDRQKHTDQSNRANDAEKPFHVKKVGFGLPKFNCEALVCSS